MVWDGSKPNTTQTLGDVVTSTNTNLNYLKTDLDSDKSNLNNHMANNTDAHGINILFISKDDYEMHKANNNDAHGIDAIVADVGILQQILNTARGTSSDLATRLNTSLMADGTIKLSNIASNWINNGDIPSYASSVEMTVPGDRTGVYLPGIIVRVNSLSQGYLYGIVKTASYNGYETTITLQDEYNILVDDINSLSLAIYAFDNTIEQAVAQNATNIVELQNQVTSQLMTKVKKITENYIVEPGIRTVLADATAGDLTITLPDVGQSKNRWLTIKKIDATSNIVEVIPSDSSTIEYSTQQQFANQGDSLNITSDGSNWFNIFRLTQGLVYEGNARRLALIYG